jgi:hypothetical protein
LVDGKKILTFNAIFLINMSLRVSVCGHLFFHSRYRTQWID